jgi:HAMP domain-containing protein
MSTFRKNTKQFLHDLSRAAAWMMRRNVGQDHWWRYTVLTAANSDPDKKRPIFDQARARQIFDELITRGLLVQRADDVDGSGAPAYAMKYDIGGWDQAVADGRPFYAQWLKVQRTWVLILLTFLLGCVLTTIENRVTGALDGMIDLVVGEEKQEPNKAVDSTATRVTPPAEQESSHGQP